MRTSQHVSGWKKMCHNKSFTHHLVHSERKCNRVSFVIWFRGLDELQISLSVSKCISKRKWVLHCKFAHINSYCHLHCNWYNCSVQLFLCLYQYISINLCYIGMWRLHTVFHTTFQASESSSISYLVEPKSIEIFLVTPQQYSCSPIQLVIHLQANKFTTGLYPKGAM